MAHVEVETGLLAEADRQQLEQQLAVHEARAGVEFLVRVIGRLPGSDYRSQAVADRRRLSRRPDSSVLLLIGVHDRRIELATAPQWRTRFTPVSTKALLDAHVVPDMRAGQTSAAVLAGMSAVADRLLAAAPAPEPVGQGRWIGAAFLSLILTIGGCITWRWAERHRCPECRTWGTLTEVTLVEPTTTSTGERSVTFTCPDCRYTATRRETISTLSDHSSDSSSSDSGSSSDSSDGGGGTSY